MRCIDTNVLVHAYRAVLPENGDYRLFRKWSAGEGGGYPRREVVSVS